MLDFRVEDGRGAGQATHGDWPSRSILNEDKHGLGARNDMK